MEIVFAVAVAWTVVVATWIVRRLTRNQRRMAEVVRRVADGDLSARVGVAPLARTTVRSDDEQLARDIDDMIGRLSGLLSAQRVFMAHAAHELRSPLTALYGELALALRRSRSADEYRDAIGAALDSTRQLRGLTEDLLAVARLGASPPPTTEAVDVREALEEAKHMVLTAAPESRVGIEIVGPSLNASGAVRDVVRLFRNLLENAIRHSPPTGTVRVTISEQGMNVSVTIRDEGTGIPEPDRELIFAPFYRGTNVPTASGVEVGLGLTIARGIARAYGGDVVVDAPGETGAGFRVTLAAVPESIEAQQVSHPARSAAGER
jgi:two-component system heavy metal sensor histidine kinase CusS